MRGIMKYLILLVFLTGCSAMSPMGVIDAVAGNAMSSPLVGVELDTTLGNKSETIELGIGNDKKTINTERYQEVTNIVNELSPTVVISFSFLIMLALIGWIAPSPAMIWASMLRGFDSMLTVIRSMLMFIPNFILKLLGKDTF